MLLTVVGVLVLVALAGAAAAVVLPRAGGPVAPRLTPTAPGITTPAELRRADVSVPRASFCDRVPLGRVRDALGAEIATASGYANGDTTPLGGGVVDVAHEYGCTWTSASGAVARAWVFAPPVTRARGKRLVALAGRAPGCQVDARPGFGQPGVATTCTDADTVTSAQQGLFGDAWLTCTLTDATTAPAGVRARSDAWCVAVAVSAAAG